MAGDDGAAAASMEKCVLAAAKEGPVLTMMGKRLRALKKKLNKILQLEESKLQGKPINKEQEEVLKTKIAVAALVDEYERLRQPLQAAVKEELAEREKEIMVATLRREDSVDEEITIGEEKEAEGNVQKVMNEVRKESEMQDPAVCSGGPVTLNGENMSKSGANVEQTRDISWAFREQYSSSVVVDGDIADLLTILYFAQIFDVRSHVENSPSMLWTKAHERSSCLSYDCVTEDETSPLLESDLDDLSFFGSLLTTRQPNATLSHRDALQSCIEHAKLWLQNSEALIKEDQRLSYSHLRERLNRILSSEYFTMIPELQTVTQQTAVAAASASVHYSSHIIGHKGGEVAGSDETALFLTTQDQQLPHHAEENYLTHFPVSSSLDETDTHPERTISGPPDEDNTTAEDGPLPADEESEEQPVQGDNKAVDSAQNETLEGQEDQKQQQTHVSNVSVGPRGQQGSRGGGRGNSYGGSRSRGYVNGRGMRYGGRGGYGNGWNAYYYDQGGYYSRGYNGRGGGRSSRGGNSNYNGYMNGQPGRGLGNMAA